jgi:3-oxoacyl-[acyl-carrier-protein] synthase-3
MVIAGTDAPEAISPPTAPGVQALLGGSSYEIPAFDVNTSCANPVYMLEPGSSIIAGNPKYGNILIIGVYAMTRFLRGSLRGSGSSPTVLVLQYSRNLGRAET